MNNNEKRNRFINFEITETDIKRYTMIKSSTFIHGTTKVAVVKMRIKSNSGRFKITFQTLKGTKEKRLLGVLTMRKAIIIAFLFAG